MSTERVEPMAGETLARVAYSFPSDWLTDDHHYDIAEAVLDALRSLPVEQRMEAMGMVPASGQLEENDNGQSRWVKTWKEPDA